MALDGAFLHIIKDNLNFLIGGKVEKVYQPSKCDLILTFKQGKTQKLLISADPQRARIQLTNKSVENPATPPMFCMLMRKALVGGKLKAIRQLGLDRVLYLDFDCYNEFGDNIVITLACEIMGRFSNIILINEKGKITDSIKRVDAATSQKRLVLPGVTYETPPINEKRYNFLEMNYNEIRDAVANTQKRGELSKVLIKIFDGVSPLLTREWVYYTSRGKELSAGNLTDEELDRLTFAIHDTQNKILNHDFYFEILKTKSGRAKEFSFIKITQYGTEMTEVNYNNLTEMLDDFYSYADRTAIIRQRADDLLKVLTQNVERTSRRIANQEIELEECADRDKYRLKADLINANLYRIKKGDNIVYLENFYKEGSPKEEIKLDPMLTPAENAQKLYKEYKKKVTAEKVLTERIKMGQEELDYFDTVLDALSRADSESDLAQLRLELEEQGYIKHRHTKSKPPKALPPLEYISKDGFKILAGRNNKQNDKLTLKTASGNDYWLHTKNIPGSHVIVITGGREPSEETLIEAAQIAAYNSKARESDNVPVDCCLAKYVKKPAGAKPGMVIFTNNKTLYVTPKQY